MYFTIIKMFKYKKIHTYPLQRIPSSTSGVGPEIFVFTSTQTACDEMSVLVKLKNKEKNLPQHFSPLALHQIPYGALKMFRCLVLNAVKVWVGTERIRITPFAFGPKG